ncbi:DUF898 family protein [Thalassospira lucentensis]|uniref:DUF898 family protein n=1 Tax=Thalassospira lucentensis TaxID=168935 RepID=UPI00142D27CC|nr:DUF898 family protein [Thalassospira lucentensis]NIZ03598.1 DUF898 family protein [Thalassospira lucentensis]
MSTQNTGPEKDGPQTPVPDNAPSGSADTGTDTAPQAAAPQNSTEAQNQSAAANSMAPAGTGDTQPPVPGAPFGREYAGGGSGTISYSGRWQDVLKLCCWNTLWTILTFGIFRFWAKTRMRRYIWSNTIIDGDALEYTGRGLELFLGFVIVTIILVPVILVINFAATMLPPELMVIPVIAIYVALGFLVFVAVYRAVRYRHSRTFWRGIRARLGGSAFKYALIGFGTTIVTVLSLGILAPLSFIATTRYETDNTWIGETQAHFTGTFGATFKRWIKSWLIVAVVIAAVVGVSIAATNANIIWLPPVFGIIAYLAIAFIFVSYRVWLIRYQAECTEMGSIRFSSDLQTSQYIKIILRFLGLSLVVMVVAVLLMLAFGGFAALKMIGSGYATDPQQVLMAFIPLFIVMLLIAPFFNIMSFTFLVHSVLAATISSLDYDGEITDLHADAHNQNIPRTGEGLAEAFDLGGI